MLACTGPAAVEDDTDAVDTAPDTSVDTQDTGDTEDTAPVDTGPFDNDGDGHPRADDCDDDNADVYPGAEETFDGEDDDCDGNVDANGDYRGNHKWQGRAWFQGQPHDFTFQCPTVLTRELVNAYWTVTCTPDPSDEWAQLLVGETLTIEPKDPYLWDLEVWTGDVIITSSNGWDTTGTGQALWKNMDEVVVSTVLDTNYLDFSGNGRLYRE